MCYSVVYMVLIGVIVSFECALKWCLQLVLVHHQCCLRYRHADLESVGIARLIRDELEEDVEDVEMVQNQLIRVFNEGKSIVMPEVEQFLLVEAIGYNLSPSDRIRSQTAIPIRFTCTIQRKSREN